MASRKFATFKLQGQLFGIDILSVREINRQLDATTVPQSPEYVHGLINLRGQIVTVLDLKKRLGLGQTDIGHDTHNIILNTDGLDLTGSGRHDNDERVSMLVDAVGDIVEADESNMETPPANMGEVDGDYLDVVVKLDNTVVTVLDIHKILGA